MNIKATIIIALFASVASHASMRAPIGALTDHDCAQRSNSLGSQMNDLQGLVHKARMIGKESGRIASNDPNTEEAKNLEATGLALFCGKRVGSLNLMEQEGKVFLVGNAHSFYADGELKCNDKMGRFFPDLHYKNTDSNFDHHKFYEFKIPPLNHETVLKNFNVHELEDARINDIVILEIKDRSLLQRQNGEPRKTIKLADIPAQDLPLLSQNTELHVASSRRNFHESREVSFETGCQISNLQFRGETSKIYRHSCDIGPGTSGSSLTFTGADGSLYSAGINFAGEDAEDEDLENPKSNLGSYFIPSIEVKRLLSEVSDNKVESF